MSVFVMDEVTGRDEEKGELVQLRGARLESFQLGVAVDECE